MQKETSFAQSELKLPSHHLHAFLEIIKNTQEVEKT